MKFRAKIDFFSPETNSQYCQGMIYTVRNNYLKGRMISWVAEKKVEMVPEETRQSVVGTGEVFDETLVFPKKKSLFERIKSWL